jgi:hypothetical protein
MGHRSSRHSARDTAEELAGRLEPLVVRARDEASEIVEHAGDLASRARAEAAPYAARVAAGTGELVAAAAPVVGSAVETVSGVLEDAAVRGGAAWDALRGERVGPPVAVRRWPWAVGAALAGAAAGAVAAYAVQRLRTQDAPDAVEPEQLQAVVDRPDGPIG